MTVRAIRLSIVIVFLTAAGTMAADSDSITIKVDQPGAASSPLLFGLMTEEINHAYDGGLYAELIQNRIFQDGPPVRQETTPRKPDPANPPHWSVVKSGGADGSIMLDTDKPVNTTALVTSLRLDMKGGGGRIGVANDGFWGIPVKPNTEYKASFYARASEGFNGPLKVSIESNDGSKELASAVVPLEGTEWKKYTATLKTRESATASTNNRFVISTSGDHTGSLWFNLVSLFPPTYHDRPNGFRIDLMEKLADLHPAFLRFPGGNYLEGQNFANRFDWKKTIGPLEDRPGHQCPWGYRSSDGLGLQEFLNWCEDLKMEPVLAVYAGLSLDDARGVITGEKLKPLIQDALDEIEYVTGDKSTKWGAERAKNGREEPFKLTYVEIGNEDNLQHGYRTYDERYGAFYEAIKEKYPNLQVIATMPVRTRRPDVLDDHNYSPATNQMRRSTVYNNYSRNGSKIFMGEWASQEGRPTPNMLAALGDAAFLGGLERNSDLVVMECYAPLLVNVNRGGSQWATNLIGYDALNSFGSASYYAQKMYATNRGDRVLPVELKLAPTEPEMPRPTGQVGVGTWATSCEFKDMKVTVGDDVAYSINPETAAKDWKFGAGNWTWDGDVLKQSGNEINCRAMVGDPKWTDYTYTLKARKLSGAEGFLILFHVKDADNWLWWNVGGWGNARSAIQKGEHGGDHELGQQQQFTVESNRWYDIKIEVKDRSIRGYIDGQLVAERTDATQPPPGPMYANAVSDSATGDVILKVVNVHAQPHTVTIDLQGAGTVGKQAQLEVLSGQPGDMNSIENPTKVASRASRIDITGSRFEHEFPANSVNVMRIKTR